MIILAGSETTATLLSGLFFHLLTNAKPMEILQQEIGTSFTSEEDMSFVNTAKLPYLYACIQEGLRLYPPSPGATPLWTPAEGITVNGEFVPPDVSLLVLGLTAATTFLNRSL